MRDERASRSIRGAALIVLAKEPVPGKVKTRLSPPCTSAQAARIAAASLSDTLAVAALVPVGRRALVLDGEPWPRIREMFDVLPQRGSGLSERLAAAFEDVDGPAFLIGMDTPQVTRDLLVDAVARLMRPGIDAVLGPAMDGGWWGLGLRRADPSAFVGVAMSTSRTGEEQRRRLSSLGLRWVSLPMLRDVDHFDDALAVASEMPGSAFAAAVDAVAPSLGVVHEAALA